MMYTVGHHAAAITEAATTCDIAPVNVTGAPIGKLVADNAYFRTAVVPGDTNKSNPDDVTTFGVGATVVSSADVSDDVVYVFVKSVFDYFGDSQKLHPGFAVLEPGQMIKDGLSRHDLLNRHCTFCGRLSFLAGTRLAPSGSGNG